MAALFAAMLRLRRCYLVYLRRHSGRATDAEAPSGHTQAGLRPGNVQEPLASRAVPHARLEVVAAPHQQIPNTFFLETIIHLSRLDATTRMRDAACQCGQIYLKLKSLPPLVYATGGRSL
jgi:hypothetical protein